MARRQRHPDLGADPGLAIDLNEPLMGLNDAVGDRQSQTVLFARLGGKKSVKDMGHHLRRNAAAVIDHTDLIPVQIGIVPDRDCDLTLLVHRIQRIHYNRGKSVEQAGAVAIIIRKLIGNFENNRRFFGYAEDVRQIIG